MDFRKWFMYVFFFFDRSKQTKKMWIFVALFLLILIGLAYVATTTRTKAATTGASENADPSGRPYVPAPFEQSVIPPAETTPPMPSLVSERTSSGSTMDEAALAKDSSVNLTVPPGSNVAVLGTGSFEIVAKGDTGSELIDVIIDGVKYPDTSLGTSLTRIRFETPRRVDLSNVILRDRSSPSPSANVDTNIRVQSIVVNDNGENVRSRLFQAGRDPNFISNGLLFWGGDFTFISQTAEPSAQANSTLPVSSGTGTIEIIAQGDVGNEEFRVTVDGLMYPAVSGTILDDGTVSKGVYVVSKDVSRLVIQTPRRVDLANVTIRYTNDAIDPATGTDRNIRLQSIVINGDGVDVRPRLFRAGLDDARLSLLRQGVMAWGGDYTFV